MLDAVAGRCLACNMDFGRTLFFFAPSEGAECPVCLDDDEAHVQLPGCTHTVCVRCYRRTERPFRCPLCRASHPSPFNIS